MNSQLSQKIGLRDIQKASFIKLLNVFEKERPRSMRRMPSLRASQDLLDDENFPVWKILILDGYTQKIIAPIFKLKELNENNVTVHLQIENDNRSPIEDSDAIALYFIEPTANNIRRIEADFHRNLYSHYSFHFSSVISRQLLEELATLTVKYGRSGQVLRVTDEYSNYICLENNLFTLDKMKSFSMLNDSSIPDIDLQNYMISICSSLVSVISSLELNPLIRFIKSSPSESLANMLESRLKDYFYHYPSSSSLSQSALDLVLILDRNCDLSVPLRHPWSYGALLYDLFDVHLNKIKLPVPDESNPSTSVIKYFDIDSLDVFWMRYRHLPFSDVASKLDEELKLYRADMEIVSNRLVNRDNAAKGYGNYSPIPSTESSSPVGSSFKSAVDSMRDLERRKAYLDTHMNIAMCILREIESRSLDKFYEFELNSKWNSSNKSVLVDFLKSIGNNSCSETDVNIIKGSLVENLRLDKLRLAMLYVLFKPENLASFKQQSEHQSGDLTRMLGLDSVQDSSLVFLRHFRGVQGMISGGLNLAKGVENSETSGGRILSPSSVHSYPSPTRSVGYNTNERASLSQEEDGPPYSLSSLHSRLLNKLDADSGSYMSDMIGSFLAGVKSVVGDGAIDNETPFYKLIERLLSMVSVDPNRASQQSKNFIPSYSYKNVGSNVGSTTYSLPSGLAQIDLRRSNRSLSARSSSNAIHLQGSSVEAPRKILIFVMGGLSYEEYLSISENVLKDFPQSHVTLGCTELMNAKGLLLQMQDLGKKISK